MTDVGESDDEDKLGMPRGARDTAAVLGLVGLVGWPIGAGMLGWLLVISSDSCGPDDPELICSARGQQLAGDIPLYGSFAAIVVGVAGMVAGPRWRALGLTLGYLINLGCSLTGVIIAAR
ncbi:hypothetical protein [Actinoplanes regularis]|nr:hypothetical protein [Actinoplanes regularis]